MRLAGLFRGVLGAGALAGAGSAAAQEVPDPVFAVQDALRRPGNVDPLAVEPRPELSPLGVRLGNYTLKASTELAAMFNSNTRVRPGGDAAIAGYIAPTVRLTSNGEHDPLIVYVAGTLAAYPARKTETAGTLAGGVDWTKEFGEAFSVRAQAEGGRYFEDRALSFSPAQSYRPVKFDRFSGTLSATADVARLILNPSIQIDRLAYHNGLQLTDPTKPLIQRTRSYVRVEPALLAGYAVTNVTALYVGGTVNSRRYDVNKRFSSHGYAVYGGVRVRPTPLVRLDIALGYQRQFYRPEFTDPKGLYARISGLYSPDRQTAVELEYRRDISETGGVQVGGVTRDRLNLSLRRSVLRNFEITATADLRRYDFASIDRRDRRLIGRIDARYIASRQLDLFVRSEQLLSRTGGTAGTLFDYDRTTLSGGVTLKL